METPEDRIVMVILILLFPPLAVWYKEGTCGCSVFLNILLYFCFVFPSYIHAVYVCYLRDRR
ncbi:Protein CBG05141 [Caenorhabditis briggsae]|uniref:Protein CBG05141 n=1 Tax=Caenorhabditis briggsae TaxID=6238 RepID=A8WZ66_CAEBR|nr:Protein CBG05141 [Caenorhabditis briggsae]CAP25676.1 Protein CBG05141 [Caenorhabditis briggsae]